MNPNPTSQPRLKILSSMLLLLSVVALSLFSSACTCTQVACHATPNEVFQWHEAGRRQIDDLDLPYDYLSGEYRALYRSHPNWFRDQSVDPGAPGSYYGK